MTDLAWLAQEAHKIHDYFESIFYALVLSLFLLGIFAQYFQWPLGGTPSFAPLVGRVFVAAFLLHAYPDISNLVANIADGMAAHLGDLNQFTLVQQRYGEVWEKMSWNWVSVKDTIAMAITYVCFYLLYFSVFLSDAFFLYTWTLLYVFSPILIALFILPATASATAALFRSLIEVACWKIVWAVLATLLWSAGLSAMNQEGADVPFLTVIGFDLILAGSVLLTPFVVHGLAGQGLTTVTRSVGTIAIGGLTLSPLSMANGARKGISKTGSSWIRKQAAGDRTGAISRRSQNSKGSDMAPKGAKRQIPSGRESSS
jgi:hypothetical protein